MEENMINIAIDGPAGAGKSTIAKKVAAGKGYIYVDTGAMYRAMALYILRCGIDPDDATAISKKCRDADITIEYRDGVQVVLLDGEDVGAALRETEGVERFLIHGQKDARTDMIDEHRDHGDKLQNGAGDHAVLCGNKM